ncbi:hydrolase, CocE/nonD family [Vibrio ishigakensis]|uniref:Hydrolase, CocE/nonD family n=2 Tax=Vibrio ishigakensis TaxID=1481914 RepID=A0A0B8NZM1_9VIBR|nr:hydrolase, CocE/nonD family [Vibrio ishigakensis]
MPWKEGYSPIRHVPEYENYLLEQWRQGEFTDYWKKSGIYSLDCYQNIPDIPIMVMSSWYDVYVKSTLDNFRVFKEKNQSETVLVMGPWLHGDRNNTHSGDVEFGARASFDNNVDIDWLSYRLRWFKKHLLNHSKEQFHTAMVFQMGGGNGNQNENERLNHGGSWINSTSWPMQNTQATKLYLSKSGHLSAKKPTADISQTYLADPNNPVPTIGGALTSGKPVFEGGAYDQREHNKFFGSAGNNMPLAARHDVLSFQTPPLEQDMVVTGSVKARLYLETDAKDTDLTIKLVDVYPASQDYPQGFAMNITDGILRCRYHKGFDAPQQLEKGRVYEIDIEAFATSNLFKAGHNIRLDIASSNFPKFDVNPNTGGAEGFLGEKVIARNTIHISPKYPSYLELEIVSGQD